ncbi:MAG: DEAD-like helicase domain-containing protein [Cenarchaeum symbiont of Oopsacas minuta]|nr:DEAD-like helicase domain-containing protein [Cenarchaeum symbiont of Oopsacas minuta]
MIQADNVIDNRNVILRDELLKILPKTGNASIAVGYFFISGLSVIISSLKDVDKIRLLISNTTDKATTEALIEGFHNIKEVHSKINETNFVNRDRKIKVISDSKTNITESLEYMNQSIEDKTVVELLIEMMKTKQLEVRVYPKEKLHAKAYIFQPKNTDFTQGMGIVGSSNLSIAGISHNSELNLKTYNSPDVNQLLTWFNELWEEGLLFTEDFNLILTKSWAGKVYSPRDLFLKAIYLEYKGKLEEQHKIDPVWELKFPKLFKFQRDAFDKGLTMFESYGGVIIGDVVGLGKTYVGTTLLKYLQLHGYRPLIICPPLLIPMWEEICEEYEVDVKILSQGVLSQDNFELYQDYRYKSRDLVLIDESHHFRNNDSRRYENIHQFMQAQDAKAILLTATPYSNSALDIKNQIMLFHQTPKTFIPPANETDLDKYFRQVENGNVSLVDLLRNIMVRRTRRYVLKQYGINDKNGRKYLRVGNENKYFPTREMKTEKYDINKVYQRKYQTIVDYLAKPSSNNNTKNLTLARYSLGSYVKDEYKDMELYKELGAAGTKLMGLIRTLLLKRMESSIEAFKQSIKHYINTHKIFQTLLDKGIIPIGDVSYKEMYNIAQSDSDSINDPETIEKFKEKIHAAGETKYKFEAFDIKKLTLDIQNDIEIFETIDGLIHRLTWKTDDKLHKLQNLLENEYSGKKIIVFSEFATTTKYLNDYLHWNGIKEQIDSSKNSIEYARRFDPDNNPGSKTKTKKSEQISLLITTDVLSEGVNLQAGEIIINYDFHWNPTRLIQRAGRIDRIGSENENIMVHNFLLAQEMKADFKLEDYVDSKINNIQQIIGEDYKILKPNEQINTKDLYAIYKGDDSILDREGKNPLEPSKFEKILRDIQVNDPKFWKEFKTIPNGIRSSNNIKSDGQLLLACESGTNQSNKIKKYYLINACKEIKEIRIQSALEILESNDKIIHSLPSNYDKLLSIGWSKFIEDVEQIKARTFSIRLNSSQKWIIERLVKMNKTEKFSDRKIMIDTLRKAYSISILKGKLNKELNKIKKSEMTDSELLERLSQLYIHYNLQNRVTRDEEESKSPRILYSKYVENQNE